MEHDKGMMCMTGAYFRFLQFSLGLCDGNEFLSGEAQRGFDWVDFFAFVQAQTLTGITFDGVQRLPKDVAPTQDLLFRWLSQSEALRKRNMLMNRATVYIYNMMCCAGYRCSILKGQGNALMYPNPYSRTPGDVDVWVDASREDIRRLACMLAEDNGRVGEESLNHIEMTVKGIGVELHSTPTIMNNLFYNRRMQQWLKYNADSQCSHVVSLPDGAGDVAVPTNAFNVVYQLCHLYHHYLYEGIGLRQFVDYYFVLKSLDTDESSTGGKVLSQKSETGKELAAWQRELKLLGLWKFAGAVMYVLHEVLGLPEGKMVAPMDARRGRLLLEEIMQGGNFGKHAAENHSGPLTWRHNVYRLRKDLRLVRYYPSECLAEPFYRLWHFFWRMRHRGLNKR